VNAIFNFFSSLRLTVVTLAMALVLVFAGTLAQVKMGLYTAQERFFSSMLIYWTPHGSDWRIPVYPGGFLLGGILLLNLVAAQLKRFSFTKKKAGIYIIHLGLIILFLGQFSTQILQVESQMAIPEGGSRNYSEADRRNELAIIDVSDPKVDKVVSIPERVLSKKVNKEITHPNLPFTVRVKDYHPNVRPKLVGKELLLDVRPRATKMNDRDVPETTVEIIADGKSQGEWTLSNWFTDGRLVSLVQEDFGERTPTDFTEPRTFEYKGRKYVLEMRSQRFYKPFTMSLLKFSFDRYLGTGVAKNYSSRVRIERPETGENREVLIYMNNPLRYWGETYYQQGFSEDETGTILQVVHNPSWLTPYVACVMVAAGLLIQFMGHLIGFARKRSA
jgi:hypothetical protein